MNLETQLRKLLDQHRSHATTVGELVTDYLVRCVPRMKSEGRQRIVRLIASILIDEHCDLPAEDFGPKLLGQIRRVHWSKNCRTTQNDKCQAVRAIWRHGVSREMVGVQALDRLRSLPAITARDAKVHPPRDVVTLEQISATLPFLFPAAADIVRMMLLTGCRFGEIAGMRFCDIESGWFTPSDHKTSAWTIKRVKLSVAAQAILAKYDQSTDGPIFRNSKANPWTRTAFWRAIETATRKNGIEHWQPSTIRHLSARIVRDKLSHQHSQSLLGHTRPSMTARYTGQDELRATEASEALSEAL